MRYFAIWNGLRGMYMPDSAWPAAVRTRRDLRSILESEASDMREAGYSPGLSKRAVAGLAAAAWREAGKPRPSPLDIVAPCGRNYAYALGCNVISRAEFEESANV